MHRILVTWILPTVLGFLGAATACDDGKAGDASPGNSDSDEPSDKSDADDEGHEPSGDDDEGCKDDICDGGFALYIAPPEGVFPTNEYRLVLDVEGAEYTAVCQVADGGDGDCDVSGDREFLVSVNLDDDLEGAEGHVFRVEALEYTEPGNSLRGPESVSIEMSLGDDGSLMGSEEFVPEYRRKEPWGEPRCGFCDVLDSPLMMTVSLSGD